MIKIDLLKNHPTAIPKLVSIWREVLGKIWVPDVTFEQSIEKFSTHKNDEELPITFIALDGREPVGMCSLRENDSNNNQFGPCLGSLVVDPKYQRQGIAKMLIDATKEKAVQMSFSKLYLFTLDPTVHLYYERLGWKRIGMDQYMGHPIIIMEYSQLI